MKSSQPSPTLEMSGHEGEPERGSDRAAGFVFSALFLLAGLWPALWGGRPRTWALAAAVAFAVVAAAAPGRLALLARAWYRLGLLLHRIVSPVVLALVYFLAVTPTGLLLRLFRRDILALARDPEADSYWVARDPPGPSPASLKNQY